MPYSIVTDHPECAGYAVIKDEGRELMGCHASRNQAERQLAALNIDEYDDRELPENYRPASSEDVPEGRQCSNCLHYAAGYCNRWEANVQRNYYCNSWVMQPSLRAPAPPEDQIEGSKKNPEGSAADKTGGIELSAETVTALENKADEHNKAMADAGRPEWTRVRLSALKAVYRRGSGAYSTSHRPGISRAAWSMARVNAFLYLARTGRPKNAAYKTDNDLLHPDHPRYSGERAQERQASYSPTSAMIAEAKRGLNWRSEFGRGGTAVGIARARDIVSGKDLPIATVRRMSAFFARHEVDKRAEGFRPGEDGYPSNGRIAWALWGGDAGRRWADAIVAQEESRMARALAIMTQLRRVL
jgi:hypothetical protein